MKKILKKAVDRLSRLAFVQQAINEKADLSAFKQRPTLRVVCGITAIGFSYVIGWPLIALLGAISVYTKQPAIVLIGGPVAYGFSHLVFLLGMYLAGARYSWIFLRWLTRITMLKLMKSTGSTLPTRPSDSFMG